MDGQHGRACRTAILNHAEAQQQKRTGVRKIDVAADTLAAWRAADSGKAFQAVITAKGYRLAQGRVGGIMVVDPAGGDHDLTRLLRAALKAGGDKMPAKALRAQIDVKLTDLSPSSLLALAAVVAAVRASSSTPTETIANAQPTGPRSIGDAFGLPRALRQSDVNSTAAGATARSADRLSAVPRLAVACDPGRSALLLPRHAAAVVEQRRARNPNDLRRADVRSRAIEPIHITGENTMAATISGPRSANIRDQLFEEALSEFRDLSAVKDRTLDQDAQRDAVADALRSMARSEVGLRERAPVEADEILAAAERRDAQLIADFEAGLDDGVDDENMSSLNIIEHATDAAVAGVVGKAVHEFQDVAGVEGPTDEQVERRDDAAEIIRDMVRTSKRLHALPHGDEIAQRAEQRDAERLARLNAAPVGDVPKRTRAEDLTTWQKLQRENPKIVRSVVRHDSRIDVHLRDGQVVRDHGDKLTTEAGMTRQSAEAMALGAIGKGWTEVRLTGTEAAKRTMAEAMVARGLTVLNPELKDYVQGLDRAHALAADRQALATARKLPDLANVMAFTNAISVYQRGLVSGASPDLLRQQKAEVMARGEAIHSVTGCGNAAASQWAAEAITTDTAQASAAPVARA